MPNAVVPWMKGEIVAIRFLLGSFNFSPFSRWPAPLATPRPRPVGGWWLVSPLPTSLADFPRETLLPPPTIAPQQRFTKIEPDLWRSFQRARSCITILSKSHTNLIPVLYWLVCWKSCAIKIRFSWNPMTSSNTTKNKLLRWICFSSK